MNEWTNEQTNKCVNESASYLCVVYTVHILHRFYGYRINCNHFYPTHLNCTYKYDMKWFKCKCECDCVCVVFCLRFGMCVCLCETHLYLILIISFCIYKCLQIHIALAWNYGNPASRSSLNRLRILWCRQSHKQTCKHCRHQKVGRERGREREEQSDSIEIEAETTKQPEWRHNVFFIIVYIYYFLLLH